MSAYNYTAFDSIGKKRGGFISAASEREARQLIKGLNLIPIDVNETAKEVANKIKVKSKTLVLATRQLATLLDSDIALDEAIKITAEHTHEKRFANILYALREEVIQGKRLGQAMTAYPSVFSNTYTLLVTAGDASGNLSLMFDNLASYLEEVENIKQKVVSALAYPIILIVFSLAVITALLTFVMPQVVDQFVRAGVALPLLTELLLSISRNMPYILLLLATASFLGMVWYKKVRSKPKQLIKLHKRFLSLPMLGGFILNAELERFSSTMYMMLNSGINLDAAMEESVKVINNKYLQELIMTAKKQVTEGTDFVVSLQKTAIFPDIFLQLIASGYLSGNLTSMFKKVSEFMKSEIESRRSMILSLLEPIVIIIMGGFILLIVLAILIPIMQMNAVSIN